MSTRWPAQVKRTAVTTWTRLLARRPAARAALVCPGEEGERRLGEDLEVDHRRAVVDVPDVELDPVLPRHGRPAVDLRPARDPRLDLQAATLPRRVPLDLVRARRPRADHAHVAADDVPELRQLVDRQAAEDPPGARDPRVALVDRVAGADLLRTLDHRPHLEQLELEAVLADAAL